MLFTSLFVVILSQWDDIQTCQPSHAGWAKSAWRSAGRWSCDHQKYKNKLPESQQSTKILMVSNGNSWIMCLIFSGDYCTLLSLFYVCFSDISIGLGGLNCAFSSTCFERGILSIAMSVARVCGEAWLAFGGPSCGAFLKWRDPQKP